MSVDLIVYLRRSQMPTPSSWQQAISNAGFPIEIDTNFDIETHDGLLPCKFYDMDSGFEYSAEVFPEWEQTVISRPIGSDFLVTLTTHSDLREFACSAAAAGALVQLSDGLLSDPQTGETFSADNILEWVSEVFAELEENYQR